jgi:anti-sigma regulatory factor (Ser/Thr protein kinase)
MSEYTRLLLLVPAVDFFSEAIQYHFLKRGWSAQLCTTPQTALNYINPLNPCVIIVDTEVPHSQSLLRKIRVDRQSSANPVILLFPSSSALERPSGLLILGDENLVQPFEFKDLLNSINIQVVQGPEERTIFQHQLSFCCSSDESGLEQGVELMHELLEQSGLSDDQQVALAAAFREAMINAAWHGHNYRADKRIDAFYFLDKEKIRIVVRDNGAGFDHRKMLEKIERESSLSSQKGWARSSGKGGLGIIIMLKCCDKIEYNYKGNEVTLTKYLSPI